MTSFFLQNFGCRVNQAEAFAWAEEFQRRGLQLQKDVLRSDFVIVNSCTLTGRADRDVRRFIRQVVRENPSARLVVTGCLVDRARTELEAMAGVWRFVPNAEKTCLPGLVLGHLPNDESGRVPLSQPYRARALVKVQDGCDFRCTFCVIPGVRGRSASVPPGAVLERLEGLAARGFREVVLTGIHLCSYGLDLGKENSLASLLLRIGESGLPLRIRLSSLDPRFLDRPLVETLTRSRSVCPHFHLSLQHGSERLLKRMGRKGGSLLYSGILDSLRRNSPEAALGADIIVGFPGETEADFEQTREFLERSPLTYFHVFSYSARPGTVAASWPQVNPALKKKRAAVLRRISAEKKRAFHLGFLGRELDAAVIQTKGSRQYLLTPNYLNLSAPQGGRPAAGDVRVKITGAGERGLEALVL